MPRLYSSQSMVGQLKSVLVKRPEDAYVDDAGIDRQWQELDYLGRPDFTRAREEHDQFCELIRASGAKVEYLPRHEATGLDSLYTHDPVASVTDRGVILANMGKEARCGEPTAMKAYFEQAHIPIHGSISAPGMIEGGDVVWLDHDTVSVGLTYRTNPDGIRQFRTLLEPLGVEVVDVPMVHWDGPGAVLHLMSVISMLDIDLAVVHDRLLPIPYRQFLLERGIRLLALPESEYATLGCNVLALAPRHCLVRAGNEETVGIMEDAGCRVETFAGDEICYKGSGGPTCLTRPVLRG